MSKVDLERFSVDLQNDPGLMEEFSKMGHNPDAWVRLADTKGYHLTSAEAEGLSSSFGELSDDDLDHVAGGWSDPPGP